MAREQHLTNGTVVAEQEIAKYMEYGCLFAPWVADTQLIPSGGIRPAPRQATSLAP